MRDDSLQAFLALNNQLLALHRAGIPVTLPKGRARTAVADIHRINAAMALQMGQGASFVDALRQNRHLYTPAYQAFIEASLASGDVPATIEGMHAQAEAVDEASASVRLSLLYPLLIVCVAYLGLILFCVLLVPRLQNLLVELRLSQGGAIHLLGSISRTLPFWIGIPPLVVFATAFWLRRSNGQPASWCRWVPGVARVIREQQNAGLANALANALASGLPFDEALRSTASAYIDPGGRSLSPAHGTTPAQSTERSVLVSRLPAFLQWAASESASGAEQIRNLRVAAELYRASAKRRLERLHVLAPAIACVVIGGSVTLAYGLMLFVPVIHLLRQLAV